MENSREKYSPCDRTLISYIRQSCILMLSFLSLILLSSQEGRIEHISGAYFGQTPPENTPVPFAEGIIPEDLHSAPVFSPDGNTLYYRAMDEKGIMVMTKEGEHWKQARPLFVYDEADNSDDPCISPTDNRLWFTYYSKEDNREYIYFCEKVSSNSCLTGQPQGELNSIDLHWQFSIARNGNIYLASNGNIYCSVYEKGAYKAPMKLGEGINSDKSECTPYISSDERFLIFARTVNEKPDLFIARRDENGAWSEARALGYGINTEHHEMCPHISPDGKYLFFLSSRAGLFSAYWVSTEILNT